MKIVKIPRLVPICRKIYLGIPRRKPKNLDLVKKNLALVTLHLDMKNIQYGGYNPRWRLTTIEML